MDDAYFQQNLPAIFAVTSEMVSSLFGPKFTNTQGSHIETEISAAASLAGYFTLMNECLIFDGLKPGAEFQHPMSSEMNRVWGFMIGSYDNIGLDPSVVKSPEISEENKPVLCVSEMTQKLEPGFLAICYKHNLPKDFFSYAAIMGALLLVSLGNKMQGLDQNIGKSLVMIYFLKGAGTVPYPKS
jgi:hypothetical protein